MRRLVERREHGRARRRRRLRRHGGEDARVRQRQRGEARRRREREGRRRQARGGRRESEVRRRHGQRWRPAARRGVEGRGALGRAQLRQVFGGAAHFIYELVGRLETSAHGGVRQRGDGARARMCQ
jgi:hypothetical protein